MTDLPVSGFGLPLASAFVPSKDDNDNPPRPKPPTRSNSRRLIGWLPSKTLSITHPLKHGC